MTKPFEMTDLTDIQTFVLVLMVVLSFLCGFLAGRARGGR